MKLNLRSISSKLIVGGVAAVLIPLIVVGYLSYTKAETALLDLSKHQAQGIASDLARLTRTILESEINKAATMASQKQIIDLSEAVDNFGVEANELLIGGVYANLGRQFRNMGSHYQGIFLANAKGELYTGVLESGKEYKGSNIASREYFQTAREKGKAVFSDIVISKSTGKPIAVVCVPIQSDGGKFIGAFGLVIKADYFTEVIPSRKIGQTGYGYMIDKKGLFLAHPKPEFVLKLDASGIVEMSAINKRMMAGETGVEEYVFKGTPKIAGFAPVGVNGWSIGATQNQEEFQATSISIRNSNIVVAIIAGLIAGFAILFAARTIVRPINAAVAGLKDIAQGEGDLTMRLEVNTRDEVGELARWFNTFIEKLQGIIKDIAGGVNTLSSSSTELSAISEQMTQGTQDV
ncbi:MAG: HAMP domain-containing protein, partial [Deltaproteobacteria bacterium]|nr:HAMP domain-containing protein [Deltaproteobacteria bacterium]